jgi:hypothetical protein
MTKGSNVFELFSRAEESKKLLFSQVGQRKKITSARVIYRVPTTSEQKIKTPDTCAVILLLSILHSKVDWTVQDEESNVISWQSSCISTIIILVDIPRQTEMDTCNNKKVPFERLTCNDLTQLASRTSGWSLSQSWSCSHGPLGLCIRLFHLKKWNIHCCLLPLMWMKICRNDITAQVSGEFKKFISHVGRDCKIFLLHKKKLKS